LPPPRRYRGAAADDRRAQRRCKLITAAIQVYGERGYQRSTIKAVCEAAGLTERYFYESFDNSEALLAASYNTVTQALFDEIGRSLQAAGRGRTARARAMLLAYFGALQRDPRSARVFLVEIRGVGRAVDEAFEASLREFGRGAAQVLVPAGRRADELLQSGVVGGILHIALRWISDGYQPALDQVAETALRLAQVLARAPVPAKD